MTPEEQAEWGMRLRPYWNIHKQYLVLLRKLEGMLEDEIKKKWGEDLEFFYVDNECVGIGHVDISRRKEFPLLYFNNEMTK